MFYFNCRRKNDIHGFAAIGAHTYWHAFATCFLRLYNPVEIEYLEPYFPNEEEKSNAALYAERIRHRYSVHAGKPISDTNFNDMRLCQYWKSRYGGEKIYAGLESHRLKLTYNATYDDLKSMMDGILEDKEDDNLPEADKSSCQKLLLTISCKEKLFMLQLMRGS